MGGCTFPKDRDQVGIYHSRVHPNSWKEASPTRGTQLFGEDLVEEQKRQNGVRAWSLEGHAQEPSLHSAAGKAMTRRTESRERLQRFNK